MRLAPVATQYLSERAVTRQYAVTMMRIARDCGDTAEINAYLRRRLAQISSVTVQHERVILLTLWRYAYDAGLVEQGPRGIVKVRVARRPTRAWTEDQCIEIVAGVNKFLGVRLKSGADKADLLRCWILLGYETGARMGDLWKMRRQDMERSVVWWTQAKTGVPLCRELSPACMKAVRTMLARSPDGRILGWAAAQSYASEMLRKYLLSINMTGTSKWLRRSGATHIEARHPGRGRLHLGHASVGLAERHYIDWSQIRRDVPQVQPLLR